MRRFLIFAGIGVAILLALAWTSQYLMLKHEKSFSPEEEMVFNKDNVTIKIFYNRPYKKGRIIFGGLVPYNEVWRTGANEATTFETNQALKIGGKSLHAGKYSLWTIPRPENWTIIFNREYGQWGINSDGKANRDPQQDVLTFDVPSVQQERVIEQFTIALASSMDEIEMTFLWDKTLVAVPIAYGVNTTSPTPEP